MLTILHRAGHAYLKLLFVVTLAGSSALFFLGAAVPKPPALLVGIIGVVLGLALEWSYFTVSCDLTQSISEGHKSAIARDGLYTLIGGAASWFLFVNAALHVGWAPTDELVGLSRENWAKIMGLLIVLVIFALSARRERPKNATDLQAIARAVQIMLPDAPDTVRLQLLGTIANAAANQYAPPQLAPQEAPRALPPATSTVAALPQQPPAASMEAGRTVPPDQFQEYTTSAASAPLNGHNGHHTGEGPSARHGSF